MTIYFRTQTEALFLMFEEWLLILIFMSPCLDVFNVSISQRQGETNSFQKF